MGYGLQITEDPRDNYERFKRMVGRQLKAVDLRTDEKGTHVLLLWTDNPVQGIPKEK